MSFYENDLTKETLWRAIILFGRNVATYKFALGKSLLTLSQQGKTFATLEELAPHFSGHICQHIKDVPNQGTFRSSKFLDACKAFNAGGISHDTLVAETIRYGFNNVIDAFHVVNQANVPIRFFRDERATGKGIALTDELLSLKESPQFNSLPNEVEARWRLVETAWSLSVSPTLLQVSYAEDEGLIVVRDHTRRIDISSCRDALNGYQKGICFYSNDTISLDPTSDQYCDVDHFFPNTLKQYREFAFLNLDGVWNLALSCATCNRGAGGKFAKVPSLKLLRRLHCRNEYYIGSHHPLRETIMNQTGRTEYERRNFLQHVYSMARERLVHVWDPQPGNTYEAI